MKIKIKEMSDAAYGAFILSCMVSVAKAEKLAKEVNAMIEKELCAVCDKPLCGEDVAHDKCYQKEFKDRDEVNPFLH